MEERQITGSLRTERDEFKFSKGDVFSNQEGNICIQFDEESFAVLTPIMAKRLRKLLDEAIQMSLDSILSEE